MQKKVVVIAISSFMIIASIVLVLVFVIFNSGSKANLDFLRVNVSDVVLYRGETTENYLELSHEEAEVKFDVDREEIINIDRDKIEAISVGQVNVTVTMSLNDKTAQSTFKVTVINYDYSYSVTAIDGCYFDEKLYTTEDVAMFEINIIDRYGQILSTEMEVTADNDAILQREIGMYMLATKRDCTITVSAKEIDFSFEIEVVKL